MVSYEKEIEFLQRIKDRWHHVTQRHPSDPFYQRAVEEDNALAKAIEVLTIHTNIAKGG